MTTVESLEDRRLFAAYYIDAQNGSDLNTGRNPHLAWQTLVSVANHSFHRGDRVYLTGTFVNETLQLGPTAQGVSVNTYGLIGPRKILRVGIPNAAVLTGEQADGVDITTSFITLQNLTVAADPAAIANGNYSYGIFLHNTTSSPLTRETINKVNVSGFSYSGLCMQGWNTSAADSAGFSNVLIENSAFHDNAVSGIFVAAGDQTGQEYEPNFPANLYIHSNLKILSCQAFNNAGFNAALNATNDAGDVNRGNSTSGGIFISSVANATVSRCIAYNNCFNCKGGVGIWAFDASQVNIQYSESYDNKTLSIDGDGFDFDHGVVNSIMQNDYAHGNAGAGFLLTTFGGAVVDTNQTIRYCIADDNQTGITIASIAGCPLTNVDVYNNTVLQSDAASVDNLAMVIEGDDSATDQLNVLNNIFYTAGSDSLVSIDAGGSGIKFERNDYWLAGTPGVIGVTFAATTYTTIADWSTASGGLETSAGATLGLVQDPGLINEQVSDLPMASIGNLALAPTSPLRREGLNLASRQWAGTAPYNAGMPYNLAGHAWGGLGRTNSFGRPINRHAIGAG